MAKVSNILFLGIKYKAIKTRKGSLEYRYKCSFLDYLHFMEQVATYQKFI